MTETILESTEPTGREMTQFEAAFNKMRRFCTRISRRFPRLVWYGDEIDVRITFKDIGALGGDPSDFDRIFRANEIMQEMGINFDAGSGAHGRDWEWDWSLRGPVSVGFRGRARNPERRVSEEGAI